MAAKATSACELLARRTCRLHDKDKRLSVGIIDCILTKGLSTISEGIPKG